MPVKVTLSPWLNHAVGGQETVQVAGATIGDCLNQIEADHPGLKELVLNKEGHVKSYVLFLLNGENTYPEELSKPVQDGDEISIVFLADGG